jgi:phosphoadenosine phosphosulfate reductase
MAGGRLGDGPGHTEPPRALTVRPAVPRMRVDHFKPGCRMSVPESLPRPLDRPQRKITMVKKLLSNGEPCAKCVQAEEMLRARGVWDQIDEVVWAKEGDAESPGARLAQKHGVELAPFFVIERPGRPDEVVQSTLKLIKGLSPSPRDSTSGAIASGGMTSGTVASMPVVAMAGEPSRPEPGRPSAIDVPPSTANEVAEAAHALRARPPQEILSWGLSRYGEACAIAFSGAEDVVLIDMAARSGLPYSVFCLDTGRLHEETYRFIDRVRAFYGIDIRVMFPEPLAVENLVRKKGLFSFKEDGHGECCGIRKVQPLKRALGQYRAWVTGQRRDQSPATRGEISVVELDASSGGSAGSEGPLIKLNPLVFWTSQQVWEYIRAERVPYNELHDHGFVSIGCQPCTRPLRPGEHERAARWWWEEATQRECGLHVKKT